ncbi:MAG TPA: hypothetical protein DEO56_02575 [Nitrosomonas nitrosa]|nr:hypothetical protein [Nitrosomonas nitrosa]HNP52183.1 sulfotransferase [Nitrosomonas nitrosa]
MVEYEGVVILGMPRSGTTLLRRLLNAHPAFSCPPETNLLSAASRFLHEDQFAGGLSIGVIPGLAFSGFEKDTVLERLREFLFDFLRDISVKAGKPYWVEKTAVDVFHINAIEALCGHHCRYICIVRHPLDVISSLGDLSAKMQSFLPEIYEYIQSYRSPIDAYAHAWLDANRRLMRFSDDHPDWCVRIRYEDLVQDTAACMSEICTFLGQPTNSDELIARAMNNRSNTGLGDWKTYEKTHLSKESINRYAELGSWTISRLAPILNPVLPQYGYEKIKSRRSHSEANTDRGQEFARMIASMKLSGGKQESNE